jgi:hypothetical protein
MRHLPARIDGNSMGPLLRPGQVVALRPDPSPADLKPGAVVACRESGGRVVLHRSRGRTRHGLLLSRGDNCVRSDPPWRPEQAKAVLAAARSMDDPRAWLAPRPWAGRLIGLLLERPFPGDVLRRRPRLLALLAWKRAPAPDFGFDPFAMENPIMAQSPDDDGRWLVQRMGDEWGVYDRRTEDYHVLNEEALTIWTEARGGAEPEAIAERLMEAFSGAERSRVESDVRETMRLLRELELLPAESAA